MIKVKICGLCTVEDAGKVNRCLPDYVGFVFAEGSKRRITCSQAREMKKMLAAGIRAVGVFVNQEIPMIAGLVREGIIDVVQLHGDESIRDILELRRHVSCPVIKAVPVGNTFPARLPAGADYLLFDTATRERGGSGKRFDWALVASVNVPFFLAGGLNEENVSEALQMISPYCVDVSSGVETDGVKDEEKMRRFIRLIREGK
ncbi:MAG: phosphoribosylanthranilate isomerase [Syntrophomonadaceae bacterium]|nr:phosphoribosylanthranilate isomerase [Syntrophomonadaceae bacterium]